MEVLTSVDAARIEALRARDEFFWLDLHEPADGELDRAGGLLGLHPLALEDSREFAQRPKLDRYPETVLLVYWTARITDERPRRRARRGPPAHLGRLPRSPSATRVCRGSTTLHDELPAGARPEDYVVYRVLDALTDAHLPGDRPPRGRASTRSRPRCCNDVRQPQLGQIHRLKQEVQQLQRRLVPQRDQFAAASEAILQLPGPRRAARASTCATSATTSSRSRASSTARPTTSPR